MAAIFIDLDGTFFQWGTEIPLPNAVETARYWRQRGHQLIFTTQREGEFARRGRQALYRIFDRDVLVISEVQNPRVLINDSGALAVSHPKNAPWPDQYGEL